MLAAGEMDVSFPEVAAFSSVLTAVLMQNGLPLDAAALLSILVGSLFGVLNDLLITKFKLESLVVTIAVAGIAKSLALLLGRGTTVSVVKAQNAVFYKLMWGTVGGIPILFILVLLLVLLLVFIQERRAIGQYIYAIGDNKEAANVAGINTDLVIQIVFILTSVFASFGGVLIMLMVNSGQPTVGSTLFLDSFTKLFLGAILFKLGKPNMAGTFVGAILMAMLVNGLTQLGTPSYISQIITGILLVVSVTVTSLLQQKHTNAMQFGM